MKLQTLRKKFSNLENLYISQMRFTYLTNEPLHILQMSSFMTRKVENCSKLVVAQMGFTGSQNIVRIIEADLLFFFFISANFLLALIGYSRFDLALLLRFFIYIYIVIC